MSDREKTLYLYKRVHTLESQLATLREALEGSCEAWESYYGDDFWKSALGIKCADALKKCFGDKNE